MFGLRPVFLPYVQLLKPVWDGETLCVAGYNAFQFRCVRHAEESSQWTSVNAEGPGNAKSLPFHQAFPQPWAARPHRKGMTRNKNRKRRNDRTRAKGTLRRLARLSGEALLQGVCRSIGYHLGSAAIFMWWVLVVS